MPQNNPQPEYPCSQAELYACCQIGWDSYDENVTDFESFSTTYDAAYGTTAMGEVLAAQALPDAQARGAIPETFRIQLVQKADAAIYNWDLLRRHIDRAWAPELVKPQEEAAGLEYHEAANKYDWEDLQLMLTAGSNYLTANAAALTAGGMPATFAAAYTTSKTDFDTLYLDFKDAQQDTQEGTNEKIDANNAIYRKLIRMFEDGKIIYDKNPAKRERFIFAKVLALVTPPTSGSGQAVTFQGVMRDNVTNAIIVDALIDIGGHTTTTGGDGGFQLSFTVSSIVTLPLNISAAGYETVNTTLQVSPGQTITQDLDLTRIVLATYQPTVGAGVTLNAGAVDAAATGFRFTLMSGTAVTLGLSNDGVAISGNTETVNVIGQIVERTILEMGGHQDFVMAQNNDPIDASVKIEVLG